MAERENQDKLKLKSITLSGFKSFNNDEHTIHFGDVTVLIGANGAGKSNVVSFFKMVRFMTVGALQQYVGEQGFAKSLLHYGPNKTPALKAKMEFEKNRYSDTYEFTLTHAAEDILIFTNETISFHNEKRDFKAGVLTFPSGGRESGLSTERENGKGNISFKNTCANLLRDCKVFQFHDTSSVSRIRNSGYINQADFLMSDGGNLAAFLYGLKENENTKSYYEKIVRHVRKIFPQFDDFILVPAARNENYIMLDWREKNNSEYKFGPHQISDGSIRFMALAALLLQPPQKLPAVIVLDEPELGLHPTAIMELAGLVRMASQYTQVVLATQSPALLDEFSADQVTVIERNPITQSSKFKKFSEEELEYWLAEDTLSEIWDKNILGGNP